MRLRKKWWAKDALLDSGLCIFDPAIYKNQWLASFASKRSKIFLELGSGRGHFISAMAEKFPNDFFLGVDMEMNAMVYSPCLKKGYPAQNLRLIVYNIECIEELFGEDEIDGIYINFCNPWPKKTQHKRRLTHPRQLLQYKKFLKKGSYLVLKTDDLDLYKDSLEYLTDYGFIIEETSLDLSLADDEYGIISGYEKKWRELKVPIKYIKARLVDMALEANDKYKIKDRPKTQAVFLARTEEREARLLEIAREMRNKSKQA